MLERLRSTNEGDEILSNQSPGISLKKRLRRGIPTEELHNSKVGLGSSGSKGTRP